MDGSLNTRVSMVLSSMVIRSKMFSMPSASRDFFRSVVSPRPRTLSRTWLKAALPSDLVLEAMIDEGALFTLVGRFKVGRDQLKMLPGSVGVGWVGIESVGDVEENRKFSQEK